MLVNGHANGAATGYALSIAHYSHVAEIISIRVPHHTWKSRTLSGKLREHERATRDELEDLLLSPRPKTRADCPTERPCPYVSCRHHMYIEVDPITGSVHLPFGEKDIDELPYTCGLDAAADGPMTLDQIGVALNKTKERIRQIETQALRAIFPSGIASAGGLGDWLK